MTETKVKKPKWWYMRINTKFMNHLHETVGNRPFTNKDAYRVYWIHCARSTYDEWMQMTVRNNLGAAAHRHMIKRLGPGKYQF